MAPRKQTAHDEFVDKTIVAIRKVTGASAQKIKEACTEIGAMRREAIAMRYKRKAPKLFKD